MGTNLKIYIEDSLSEKFEFFRTFTNCFSNHLSSIFGKKVQCASGSKDDYDIALCAADSEEEYKPVLPIVIDEKIGENYSEVNSFSFPEITDSNKEQVVLNLTFAILSCLGIGNFRQRIFISYKRSETEDLALGLYRILSSDEMGFEVFLDTRKLDVGTRFMDDIRLSIADADIFLLLDSPKYWDSEYTKKELFAAMSSFVGIIRVRDEKFFINAKQREKVIDKLFDALDTVVFSRDDVSSDYLSVLKNKINTTRISFFKSKIERFWNLNSTKDYIIESLWSILVNDDGCYYRYCPIVGVPTSYKIEGLQNKVNQQNTVDSEIPPFSILFDHWNLPHSHNNHIKWIIDGKKGINMKTLQELNTTGETVITPVVLLSASLPNSDVHYDFSIIYNIIVTLVEEVINRNGVLVFGGHPTITPIIANMMNIQLNKSKDHCPNIFLYQSAFFLENERPIENKDFPLNHIIDIPESEVPKGDYSSFEKYRKAKREKSLEDMRDKMIKSNKFTHAIFIGGQVRIHDNGTETCGIWDECQIFHTQHSEAKCIAFNNTGTNIDILTRFADIIVPETIEEFIDCLNN